MIILVADDEDIARRRLVSKINEVVQDSTIIDFGIPEQVVDYVKSNEVDIDFLDIEMGTVTGIEVAREIKKYLPSCNSLLYRLR